MDITTRKLHPLIMLAAVSVLIFSVLASAKALGWLPVSSATAAESGTTTTIEPIAEVPPAPLAKEQWYAIENPEPSSNASASDTGEKDGASVRVAEVIQQPIQNKPYAEYGNQSRATVERYASCIDCGVVTGINTIAAAPNGPTGIGAALGAIAGGVIGHQFGAGNGRRVATLAGALGGAYAGNHYEGSRVTGYEISVRLDSGELRSFHFDSSPGFSVGDAVRIAGGQVVRR